MCVSVLCGQKRTQGRCTAYIIKNQQQTKIKRRIFAVFPIPFDGFTTIIGFEQTKNMKSNFEHRLGTI